MEKIAYEIERLLQEKLSLYQKLKNILEEEKNYVVDMDVDSLWITIAKKKSLALNIEEIRQKISCLFDKIDSGMNMDAQSFSLSYVIKFLNVSSEIRVELGKIKLAINTCKKEIAMMACENQNFIKEYLTIIDGVFSTVMATADKKGYNNSGTVSKSNGRNCLINAEV